MFLSYRFQYFLSGLLCSNNIHNEYFLQAKEIEKRMSISNISSFYSDTLAILKSGKGFSSLYIYGNRGVSTD